MSPHDGEEDPAVYRSGSSKAKKPAAEEGQENGTTSKASKGENHDSVDEDVEMDDGEGGEEDEEGDDEDGTLLTVQPRFNRLLLVLRDEGVMHFVKYVSAGAPGSRWDVCGEYEVAQIEIEVDEDGEETDEGEE